MATISIEHTGINRGYRVVVVLIETSNFNNLAMPLN